MGFFDFIADAGSRLFESDEKEPEVTKPIAIQIKEAGVMIDNMNVDYNMGKVTLSGYVPNQEQKEKAVLVAGNVKGVSGVQDNLILGEPPADQAEQEAQVAQAEKDSSSEATLKTYTVKSGDTLGKIAQEMYGKASMYPKIFEANTPMLKDPNKIYVGQVLKIPE